MTHSFEVCYYS